ncbi:aminotransferase class V-fold PLP-dependent enzyme [Candidatus Berkelbacteria bacterium]|nr:aminotransferase class V-fold PLP-dependent enzyme [Candidatus Berkelbacteria bacterium]
MPRPVTKRIYLDAAAATPLWPTTRRALGRVATLWGNPGSPHAFGRQMRSIFDAALGASARLLNVRPDELVITAGATESANLAILGVVQTYHAAHGRWPHLITTQLDHPAVVAAAQAAGATVTYLPVDLRGRVSLDALRDALTPETGLVSIIAASNELGTIQPLRAIASLLARHGTATGHRPLFHTDAAQLAAWQRFTAAQLGADLITLSAAKLGGPVSAGLLFVRRGIKLAPVLHGGGQQAGRRPGTEDVAAAVGLSSALAETWHRLPLLVPRIRRERDRLRAAITSTFPTAVFHGDPDGLPSFLVVSVPGLDAQAAAAALDAAGIAVSTGAACTSSSDVFAGQALRAIGQAEAVGHTLRITLGHHTTRREIDGTCQVFPRVLRQVLDQSTRSRAILRVGQQLARRYAR